ncbi:Centrosomal protein kizuna [Sciurus carolinensis]|uniref:Centrosomal protein kizuna n=1 Tax=Sciurus carolinensis TaxID=30640 RepID=A0AA41TBS0_SCICA|nr:Centrosomal protein kizuna [Sciurus carolinensis]
MHRAPASSAPLASPDYYERVGHLQHGLRDSEKKRLDLEKKLCEYNQSDICRVKLKYVKLKKYLKEICDSEKKARTRNQEYLKRFERVQAHVGHFSTNTEKLQKLKIEYESQIKKMQLLSKDSLGIKGELKDEDRGKVTVQAGINLGTTMSKGLYQPATMFMGRQMSAISSLGDFSTEQKSPQPTKNFSILDPHSHQQTAQRSNVTDSYVVQTNSDTECLNKSDKIDGKTSLQIGEKMPVTASVLSEEEQTHCLEIGSNIHHSKSNLSEGKKSAELHSSLQERLSPENRTTDLKCDSSSRSEGSEGEILTREHIEVEEERASPPVSAISVSEHCASENKWSQEKHSAWEGFSDHLAHEDPQLQKMQEEQEEESLCSSNDLTVSISEDDLILRSPEPQPNPSNKIEGKNGTETLKLIYSEQKRDALSTEKNNHILQTLSFPDSEEESSANSPRKSEQVPDSDLLRAHLGQYITTLKEHDNPLEEEATALLKKALTEECGHRSAIHSNESSCSLPCTLNDNSGIKEAKPVLWLNSVCTRKQEASSGSRDERKEESLTAKVPITETKAYKLLKKSTLQDNTNQTEDRFPKARASTSQFSAFWGESDDSNSEIEAALRPKNYNTSADDFDDFYD